MNEIELWEQEITRTEKHEEALKEASIYNFYDVEVVQESNQEIGTREINFFGKKATVRVKTNNPDSKLMNNIDVVLKAVCTSSLWDYLYKLNKEFYDNEINEDPYFKGKKIKSGKDLSNSVDITNKNTAITVCDNKYRKCIYFCGEYWVDEEHGFSITFPDGKFKRAGKDGKTMDSNWEPIATGIGQYADSY